MPTNSQAISPLKDLLDRVNELQQRFEDLEPSIRQVGVRSQYENARTKVADARSAIMALVNIFERKSNSK
jgi:chemotaxis regulatin CheY-phosphate phosphatase CheZ